jgi:transcriptional regulator with XRE-family HTH domain
MDSPRHIPEVCVRICTLWESVGATQEQLSMVSGVTADTIGEIERGLLPLKRTVLRLAEGFRFLGGCDVTGLVESVPTQWRGLPTPPEKT